MAEELSPSLVPIQPHQPDDPIPRFSLSHSSPILLRLRSMISSLYRVFINVSFLAIITSFITVHFSSFSSTPLRLITDRHAVTRHDPHSFVDYLHLFYSVFGQHPSLGYTVLALWSLVLFYLLGNTASLYFCSSLEGLSKILGLPPTIAGVTLLALGNGAPDVFASFASFSCGGTGEVGISSILGGAFFVSTVVVGVISIYVAPRSAVIDKASFLRDSGFLIVVLCSLLLMLVKGKLTVLTSVCFSSLYIVYVLVVSSPYCCRDKNIPLQQPLLDGIGIVIDSSPAELLKPEPKPVSNWLNWIFYLIDQPLSLPRRLTIPDIDEGRWSKPFAVASAALSPVLLAALLGFEERLIFTLSGLLLGLILGIITMETTETARPPSGRWRLPWLAGGFLMSVVWTYMTAGELVALLLAVGKILNVSPGMLGLTVLAWGNSLGDLIANMAIAVSGGDDAVQIAISGCYAGPIFNTLVGLGVPLVLSSWKSSPSPVMIDSDKSIYETVGFLIVGLVWAIVVVPRRRMKVDRVLGFGLLGIYLCFLCLRLWEYVLFL